MAQSPNELNREEKPVLLSSDIMAISRIINYLLPKIGNGEVPIGQLIRFLDWFLDLSIEDREEMFGNPEGAASVSPIKLVSEGKLLRLSPLSGSMLICHSRHLFSDIALSFRSYTEQGRVTSVTPIAVYQVTQAGNFRQAFESIERDLLKICLTQHQILNFIKLYRKWLQKQDGSTAFLFSDKASFVVARIEFDDGGLLKAFTNQLDDAMFLGAARWPRIVVPRFSS
jgi:hypothetical protein